MATQVLELEQFRPALPKVAEPSATRRRVDLRGVLLDRVDRPEAIDRISGFLESGTPHQIVTVNLDFLAIAQTNPRFRDTLNLADLAVADGMPLVWVSRLRGEAVPERVTGVWLAEECCRIAAERNAGVFLLGAAPGVAAAAGRELETRYPGLRVVGAYAPPIGAIDDAENDHILEQIRQATPSFLFVALGAPRQDLWIRDNLQRIGVPVAMGVGCVFDVLAGRIDRAPAWMQRAGLEWAFRLGREPRRLWRRYLVQDTPMLGRLLVDLVAA